jgi:hypothetical protein
MVVYDSTATQITYTVFGSSNDRVGNIGVSFSEASGVVTATIVSY